MLFVLFNFHWSHSFCRSLAPSTCIPRRNYHALQNGANQIPNPQRKLKIHGYASKNLLCAQGCVQAKASTPSMKANMGSGLSCVCVFAPFQIILQESDSEFWRTPPSSKFLKENI